MDTEKVYDFLKIGLTEGEAKVYLALAKLGTTTVGPIVKEAGVAYSNVYDILNRLLKKGIVSYIIKSRTKYFQAASPSNLMEYLEKKEQEVLTQKSKLKELMPKLDSLMAATDSPEAEVFVGKKGLKTGYLKFLKQDEEEEKELLFFYLHEEDYAEESDIFYMGLKNMLVKIPMRGISNLACEDSVFMKYMIKKGEKFSIRLVDFPIPGNIEVCGDKIMIVSWKPLVGILIHSKSVADNTRDYFNKVWETAKK